MKSWSKEILPLILLLILPILRYVLGAWIIMFGLKVIHEDVTLVPPLGFGASFWILLIVGVVVSIATVAVKETQ